MEKGSGNYEEGGVTRGKEGSERVVFKDMGAMGKLPPTHEIDAVHLAQREMNEMKSDFTQYHPWLPKKKKKKEEKKKIYPFKQKKAWNSPKQYKQNSYSAQCTLRSINFLQKETR